MKAAYIKLIAVCLVIGTLVPSVYGGDLYLDGMFRENGSRTLRNGRFILDNMSQSMKTVIAEIDENSGAYIEDFPGDSSSIDVQGTTIDYKVNFNGNSITLNIPNAKITKYNIAGQVVPMDYVSNNEGTKIVENKRAGVNFYHIMDDNGKNMTFRTVFDGQNFGIKTSENFGKFIPAIDQFVFGFTMDCFVKRPSGNHRCQGSCHKCQIKIKVFRF